MMQVRTEPSLLSAGDRQGPALSVSISPQALPGHLIAGIGLGILFGFILGSIITLLIGDKSLLLAQHLWNRLVGAQEEGDHVHFELLLQ